MNPFPALALVAFLPSLVVAQLAPIRPAPSLLFAAGEGAVAVQESSRTQDDHRVAGAVIGGITGGAVGYLAATAALYEETGGPYPASSNPDDGAVLVTSLVTVGGAALGAWLGHRIGAPDPNGAIPKIPDHRITGAMIGGVMGGVLGYFAGQTGGDPTTESASGAAEMTGHAALTTLAGATLGGTIGYLMGRSTPKAGAEPRPEPLAPIVDTGIKSSTGAAMGAVVGALVFGYAAMNSESGDGEPAIIGISLGVLLGSFVGYGVTRE